MHASERASSAYAYGQLPAAAPSSFQPESSQSRQILNLASDFSPAILASPSVNSSSSTCVLAAKQHAVAANEGGSTSSVMPVQGIALQGGSSSALPQVLQNRDAHEQRPLVVPPRDITNTTVASTSQLHIKASRDVSRLCIKLRGPRPRQSPVLSSRLTQRRRGIGISAAR